MSRLRLLSWIAGGAVFLAAGCHALMEQTDRQVAHLIEARQEAALHYDAPPDVAPPDDLAAPAAAAYAAVPDPSDVAAPASFQSPAPPVATTQPTTAPAAAPVQRLPEPKPGEATSLLDRAPWLTPDKGLVSLV